MRGLFCGCLGGLSQCAPQPTAFYRSETPEAGTQPLAKEHAGGLPSVASQALTLLRARLACTTSQTWSARLTESAALIADICDAGLIGLLGLTGCHETTSLVVLATGGPAAAALGIGEILPWEMPHTNTGTNTNSPGVSADSGPVVTVVRKGSQSPRSPACRERPGGNPSPPPPPPAVLPLPPWEPPPCLRNLHPRVTVGRYGTEPTTEEVAKQHKSATAAAAVTAVPPPSLFTGEAWARALTLLQHALPRSGPSAQWHVMLLPLWLGEQHVGGLLLALPAAAAVMVAAAGNGPPGGAKSVGGGASGSKLSRKQQQQASAAALQGELFQREEVLVALAKCVAECCLAPVLQPLKEVCTSCMQLDACSTLHELSTCLTAGLTNNLSNDLHVELGVRLALLPYRNAPQGVLFEDPTRPGRDGGGAAGSTAAVPFLAVHRTPRSLSPTPTPKLLATQAQPQRHPQQGSGPGQSPSGARAGGIASGPGGYCNGHSTAACMGTGVDTSNSTGTSIGNAIAAMSSMGNVLSGTGLASRFSALQMEAARAGVAGSTATPTNSDDVLCAIPRTAHGAVSVMGGGAMAGRLALASARRDAGGGGGGCSGRGCGSAGRRTLLALSSRNQIRASTLNVASSLAAALLSSSGAAADGASTCDGVGGGGGGGGGDGGGGGKINNQGKILCNDAGVACAAIAPYAVQLAGAVIANVHSYLQDMDQPTADVFTVLRRHESNATLASLVTVAAWSAAAAGAGAATHSDAFGGGTPRAPAGALALSKSPPGQQSTTCIVQTPCRGMIPLAGWDGSLAATAMAAPAATGPATAASTASISAATAVAAAITTPIIAPAFVLYLTSATPLPPQLLGAVRDRAMALLEVLLPTAARLLTNAVHDEWTYLCAQMGTGGVGGVGANAELRRSCSLVPTDHALANVMAGAPMCMESPLIMSSSRSLRVAAAAAALPLPQPSHSAHGMVTPSMAAHSGIAGCGGGAAAAAVMATMSPVLAGRRSETSPLVRSGQHSRTGLTLREDSGVAAAGGVLAGAPAAAAATPPSSRQTATGRSSQRCAPAQRLDLENCQQIETFPSSLLTLGEDDEGADSDCGGGTVNAISTTAAALLSTVLSNGHETAKTARQAQLDIMVSTYHSALNKVRHDAGSLGGVHAEDDVRNLRLIKTIGLGGCSVVLLARLHAIPVAVKVILPSSDDDDDDGSDDADDDGQDDNGEGGAGRQRHGTEAVAVAVTAAAGGGGLRGKKAVGEKGDGHGTDSEEQMLVVLPQPASPESAAEAAGDAAGGSSNVKKPTAAAVMTGQGSRGGGRGRRPTGRLGSRVSAAARQMQMRLLMRGARELAVMASISHPNIVQVYSYCTRVVVQEMASGLPKLEVVTEGASVEDPICTAVIMEYCDMGSLADAIDSGAFARATKAAAAALQASTNSRATQSVAMGLADRNGFKGAAATELSSGGDGVGAGGFRSGSCMLYSAAHGAAAVSAAVAATAGTPAMRAIYLTLLEVALALRHLHSLSLVHSDVKPANVLLRSSAIDPRGFTAKLTDFGFVNLIDQQRQRDCGRYGSPDSSGAGGSAGRATVGSVPFAEPVGTVTHMAPELFIQGHPVDSGIDIYAFGILMWELCTGRAPYQEYAEGQFMEVPVRVVKEGLRPRFPSDTPLHYKLLAQESWSSRPARRPTAAALVSRLQQLLDLSCGIITSQEDAAADLGGSAAAATAAPSKAAAIAAAVSAQ